MTYHVIGGHLVEVADNGKVSLVLDGTCAYKPVNGRHKTGLSLSYVRGNKNVLVRENRPVSIVPVEYTAAKIIVASRRCNSTDLCKGWRICGGIPCYVDQLGCVTRLYHNGVYVPIYNLWGGKPFFAAWKFAIGSQSAETLVSAALQSPQGSHVVVQPCRFRERGVWRYDHA